MSKFLNNYSGPDTAWLHFTHFSELRSGPGDSFGWIWLDYDSNPFSFGNNNVNNTLVGGFFFGPYSVGRKFISILPGSFLSINYDLSSNTADKVMCVGYSSLSPMGTFSLTYINGKTTGTKTITNSENVSYNVSDFYIKVFKE